MYDQTGRNDSCIHMPLIQDRDSNSNSPVKALVMGCERFGLRSCTVRRLLGLSGLRLGLLFSKASEKDSSTSCRCDSMRCIHHAVSQQGKQGTRGGATFT